MQPLSELAAHLAARREDIVTAWRQRVAGDPKLTTSNSLPQAQLNDHIPALLEDFERRLAARHEARREQAEDAHADDAAAHGLHRWHQGFNLSEVTRELGLLNECMVAELDAFAAAHTEVAHEAIHEARKIWAELNSEAVASSASQYFQLQQLEVAGHLHDLERALETVRELEAQRAQLWQQAAHDLRGNVGVLVTAAAGLASTRASDEAKSSFLSVLGRNVRALHLLLEDVTSLARLQGGQEARSVSAADAAALVREMAEELRPLAEERGLFLHLQGPASLPVEGDTVKIRRVLQNLVLNAVRYTRTGGITVSWGPTGEDDAERWFVQVQDTGPGFHAGPGSRLMAELKLATDRSNEMDADAASGAVTHAADHSARQQPPVDHRPVRQQQGEGIGLSIVKRLCELLDATIELDSTIDVGTTFRVILPRHYQADAS